MYRLYLNFPKEEKQDILECLKIAEIEEYSISTAFDKYGNSLDEKLYCGLYFRELTFYDKDIQYKVAVFDKTRIVLKSALFEKYKKLGFPILKENKNKMRMNMNKEYLKRLCTEIINEV